MASLKSLRDMKNEFGTQLSNLLRFVWRCYWKKKQKKKKKKKGKKGKKKVNKDLSATVKLPARSSTLLDNSVGKNSSPSKG